MPTSSHLQFTLEEVEMIISGMEILSPDSIDADDLREDLEARFRAMHEDSVGEIELTADEVAMLIAGVEILSPDEEGDERVREDLCDRLRENHELLDEGLSP